MTPKQQYKEARRLGVPKKLAKQVCEVPATELVDEAWSLGIPEILIASASLDGLLAVLVATHIHGWSECDFSEDSDEETLAGLTPNQLEAVQEWAARNRTLAL